MAEGDIGHSKLQCHTFLEELLQDDDIEAFRRLSLGSESEAVGLGQKDYSPESVVVLDDEASDDGTQGVDTDAAKLRGSPQRCCCGDRRGFNMRDALQDETSGIVVATGGRFPCLHIGVSGLRQDRRYLLALDFCHITCDVDLRFLELTEPYYMPRPNHLEGRQWMNQVLHFNLTSIANGGLQESDMTLKMNCEYEPTLRILEQRDDDLLSGTSAIRFALKGSEFLVVSLTSEVRYNKDPLAREFLLVRKSEMTRGKFSPECYPSPPSRNLLDQFSRVAAGTPVSQQYEKHRRSAHTDYRIQSPSTKVVRTGSSDAIPIRVSEAQLPAFGKPPQDVFSGGSWKSMPPVPPTMQQPPQQTPQQRIQPPIPLHLLQPRGAPRPSGMSTSSQLELNALFQRLQNTAARPIMDSCVPSYSVATQNETRQPVAPFPSQPQDVDWSKRGSAALPTQRVNFDTVPSNYLRWVALARSNLARPAVDQCQPQLHLQHLQQLQLLHQLQQQERQQMRQEMGTQVGTQAVTSDNNDAELDSSAGMSGHSVTYFSP
ncbi:hypothetical protein HPB47_004007 [Ixodes persulcatus]|uniref:Uncharacterized protein n=1 Tax=Ixodes persulcatus TaxID=34615 RepID=A0AC60PH48_IXOPE|nr:hypothetical protein HPB47_004007 [Ixodes persulcatus]